MNDLLTRRAIVRMVMSKSCRDRLEGRFSVHASSYMTCDCHV